VATIEDVVKKSGVSRSTVFRFLNGSNVRADAKKAIIQAMEELNYKTELIYKHHSISIDVSIAKNFEGFQGFTEIVQGITQRADEKGIRINLVRHTGDQILQDYERWNTEKELKGVIVIGKNKEDEKLEMEMLRSKKIPHIFVNRVFEERDISYVAVDLKQAAYDIVNYLIQKGHQKIAVIGKPDRLKVDEDKMEGYREAFHKNDIKVSDEYFCSVQDSKEWEKKIHEILSSKELPTAYFGICDSHAIKFMHIAESYGYKVPEDIAVVGMDDVEIAAYSKPTLTTIHIPFQKMGILAVDQLVQLIMDEEICCTKTIVGHTLIERSSS